jgi:hypothetical protein
MDDIERHYPLHNQNPDHQTIWVNGITSTQLAAIFPVQALEAWVSANVMSNTNSNTTR